MVCLSTNGLRHALSNQNHQLCPYLHIYQPIRSAQFANLVCIKSGTWAGTFSIKDSLLCLGGSQFKLLTELCLWVAAPFAQINVFIFITV